jgi:hypothetical protein
MHYHPNHSGQYLSPDALARPASRPPLPYLRIRIASLPWDYIVRPDPTQLHRNGVVTVQDVLVALYSYHRMPVNRNEYNAIGKYLRAELFERRVHYDPDQRGRGLRLVDFLDHRNLVTEQRIIAEGLVPAKLLNDV